MLLKVLVVDDEPLVRGYIRSLIDWESCGFIICGEAADGNDALSKMDRMQPDIVLLDIYMPGMDGVTLSKQIADRYRNAKIVVLSSYDNYDYVRETLKIGVVDYLLKHRIDADVILSTLQKARDMILEEVRKNEQEKRLARERENVSPTLVQNYIKELVLGNKERFNLIQDYFQSLNLYVNKGSMIIGVMQINYFDLITYRYKDNQKNLLVKNILDMCRQIIQDDVDGCVTYIEQGRFALLLSFNGSKSESNLLNRVYEYKSRIESSLKLFLSLQAAFGFSPVCSRLFDIDRFYQTACREMEQKAVNGSFHEEAVNQYDRTNHFIALSINQEKQLLNALEMGNRGLVDLVIDEVFNALKSGSPSSKGVQIIAKELLDIAFKVGRKACIDLEWIDSGNDARHWSRYESLEDIESRIKGFYNALVDEMHRVHYRKPYSRYVQQALEYIDKYYKADITLEKAAKDIGITNTYLSKLFKEDTGISFTEYLNKVRIEVSKKFMDSGESVKEIYGNVGFKNYSYFFKVFKELTGSTPLEYMNKKDKEQKSYPPQMNK